MLGAFTNAFKTPDLRRKILFTMMIMAIYRFGTYVPAPGVNYGNVNKCLQASAGKADLLDMLNLFSGGGLLKLSVFALGIMPYITASIIVQLMRVVIPRFEQLQKEGGSGQAKLTEYTRFLTIGLAIMQSTVIVSVANNMMFRGVQCPNPIPYDTTITRIIMIVAMTAGTGLIMWLAELITERGIGNGMSLLIFTGIAASIPQSIITQALTPGGWVKAVAVLVLFLAIVFVVVYVEEIQRRVPVQYAKRMIGRRMVGGSSTYIPIKANMANVIPVIFSSSLLAMPMMIAQFGQTANGAAGWASWLQQHFGRTSWLYLLTFALLTLFFAFFYTFITFNPDDIADNMKKYGGFVPGFRAGKPTADHLRYILSRLTWVGAIYLTLIALIPNIAFPYLGITGMAFGGTSIIILVGVGQQTVKDIDAQLMQRDYEGFLR